MVTYNLQDWLDTSDENQRLFAQEKLILAVTERIWEQMEHEQVSRSDLAERLGKSKAHVTQLLNGSRNMTLRTLADIAFALGTTVRVGFDDDFSANGWEDSSDVTVSRRKVYAGLDLDAANAEWTDLEAEQA